MDWEGSQRSHQVLSGVGAEPADRPLLQERVSSGDTAAVMQAAEIAGAQPGPVLQRKGANGALSSDRAQAGELQAALGRSGGQQLPPETRGKMEGAFGSGFSSVRIHEGSGAEAMGALAMTQGEHIHFSPGQYNPASESGQRLLGHELAHVVQQRQGRVRPTTDVGGVAINDNTGLESEANRAGDAAASGKQVEGASAAQPASGKSDVQQACVQRLALHGTNWDAVTSGRVTQSSAIGVAILSDGDEPVVVKDGEGMHKQILMAGNLMQAVLHTSQVNNEVLDWVTETTESRLVTQDEAMKLFFAVNHHTEETPKQQDFLDGLTDRPTGYVVFSFVSGDDLQDTLDQYRKGEESTTKTSKRLGGKKKKKARTDTLLAQLWTNPGLMTMLGRGSAVDIFTGNSDRMLGVVNAQNIKLDHDTQSVQFIDNVNRGDASLIGGAVFASGDTTTQQAAFVSWSAKRFVPGFLEGNYDLILDDVVDLNLIPYLLTQVPREDGRIIRTALNANNGTMKGYLREGLEQGRAALIEALSDENIMAVLNGVPENAKIACLTGLLIRRGAIQHNTLDWATLEPTASMKAVQLVLPDNSNINYTTNRRGHGRGRIHQVS